MIRSNISSVINRNNYLNLIRFSTRINQQISSKDSDPLPQTSSGFNQQHKSDKSGNAWTAHAYSFKGKQRDVSNFPDPQQPLTSQPQSNTNASTSTSSTSSTTTSSTYDNDSKPKSRLRARAAAINLSPSAVEQLRILSSAKSQLLRVGVKNKGCSGMSYHLEYVDKPAKFDEIVEQDGVKVLVDSKALFSVIGSTMDWVDDRLSSKFVFDNPNVKETCGCNESFSVNS